MSRVLRMRGSPDLARRMVEEFRRVMRVAYYDHDTGELHGDHWPHRYLMWPGKAIRVLRRFKTNFGGSITCDELVRASLKQAGAVRCHRPAAGWPPGPAKEGAP